MYIKRRVTVDNSNTLLSHLIHRKRRLRNNRYDYAIRVFKRSEYTGNHSTKALE